MNTTFRISWWRPSIQWVALLAAFVAPGEIDADVTLTERFTTHSAFRLALQGQPPLETQPLEAQPLEAQPLDPSLGDAGIPTIGGSGPIEVLRLTDAATTTTQTADLTEQLVNSSSTETIRAQRRSPVSFDPRIRGYRGAQIYSQADGAWWRPSRDDLDTMLSKLAPSSINSVRLLNGPYGVVYGPGFSFIDVLTTDTPRHECHDSQNTIGVTYRANGDQWYGYDSYEGGGSNWGYRFGYGNRTGIDYESGNGTDIPSSYHSQDYAFQMGYDLNPFQKVEFRYLHVDQTDTEYFGRFFDINALITDAFNLRLVDENPCGPWTRFLVEGWYNQNPYHGDTFGPGKASTTTRVERALERRLGLPMNDITFGGLTAGYIQSIGARAAVTFGDDDGAHLVAGVDARYLRQQILERFTTNSQSNQVVIIANQIDQFSTNQPTSWMTDPGAFLELTLPITSYWKAVVGGRVDWIHTDAREGEVRQFSSLPGTFGGNFDLAHDDTTYAFFWTNEVELDETWTAELSFGHAQRPPTLTERYADGMFLGLFQNGFSRVIGNPLLDPERAWQVDAGIRAQGDYAHGGVRLFHTWIFDYVTYEVITINDPTGAILVRGAQSDLATLAGFELFGDWDWTEMITLFGNVSYIDGRDRDIDAPLTGIYPFETRVGARYHEAVDRGEQSRWAVELFGRLVDRQDRIAAIRNASGFGTSIVEAPTSGFMVWHLRGLWEARPGLKLTAGVDNLLDKNYLEHLDLRLPAQPQDGIGALSLFAPGITPYIGIEWTR